MARRDRKAARQTASARESLAKPWTREAEYQDKQHRLEQLRKETDMDGKGQQRNQEPQETREDPAGRNDDGRRSDPPVEWVPADQTGAETLEHITFDMDEGEPVSGWWSDLRLDPDRIPDGWHRYAVRGGDDGWEPANIERNVLVNHTADIVTRTDLDARIDANDGWLGIREWGFDDGRRLVIPGDAILRRNTKKSPQEEQTQSPDDPQEIRSAEDAANLLGDLLDREIDPTDIAVVDADEARTPNAYSLLSRLQEDCKYFIEHPADKHLWAGSVEKQVAKMREIYDKLPDKPEWLTSGDIDLYERQMLAARARDTADPDIALEERRKTAIDKALARCDDLERDAGSIRLLHDLVDEIHRHRPQDTGTGTYRVIAGGTAVETLLHEGMTRQWIDEAARFGGWNRERDEFVRFNTDGDLTGLSSAQADQLVWEHRREIIEAARWDGELSQQAVARLERLADTGRGSRGDFLSELDRRSGDRLDANDGQREKNRNRSQHPKL